MLVAAGLLFLFLILDLVLTEFNSLTLITLTQHYATATIDIQRSAYLTAADYALTTTLIASFYSWVIGCIGFLITSVVILNGIFGKRTAYLGIIILQESLVASIFSYQYLP